MSPNSLSTLGLIALMAVAFYFLILRPQRKRQQAQQKTMNSLVPGTRVMTGSGIFGTILAIGEKQAVLEISPGVELTVLKGAIARVATEADEDTVDEDEGEDEDDEEDVDQDILDEQIVESDLVSDPAPAYETYERPSKPASAQDASGTDSTSAKE